MPYGPDAHGDGYITYSADVTHTGTGVQATISVVILPDQSGVYPTEARRDAVFQAFLNRIAGMPDVTLTSASKRGSFVAPVTPG